MRFSKLLLGAAALLAPFVAAQDADPAQDPLVVPSDPVDKETFTYEVGRDELALRLAVGQY